MNPSASGWIEKYYSLIKEHSFFVGDEFQLYKSLRSVGFIYGTNVQSINIFDKADINSLSDDELAKINLLTGLYGIYKLSPKFKSFEEFLSVSLDFYRALDQNELSFWDKIMTGSKKTAKLEKLIHSRVQLDDNLFTRNFNQILTNALLFVDVLAFKRYLKDDKNIHEYASYLETTIINMVYTALNTKKNKTDQDKQLTKLFESSTRYRENISETDLETNYKTHLEEFYYLIEKMYLIDLSSLAVLDDGRIDEQEGAYINTLGMELGLTDDEVQDSLHSVESFFSTYKDKIVLFKDSNPVKNFYDNSTAFVRKLIVRNQKRLITELSQSKELIVLLSQSTVRDLNEEEKEKVKTQLLDICKAVPSLAIFMLPGGGVLLPLFIKLIPKMLPSAFDDNRIDTK
ncbi:LETM1-related biofilm-associated protein [Zhouia sp. PK063]|uniref:LETM1-related biofilm-associated protein n=1 Tax=Zhouia sp. PK063 TaxID=3373602 RepID=UPI00378C31D4